MAEWNLLNISYYIVQDTLDDNIRFETLHKITLADDTETLLKGNNLYRDRDNEEIFKYVHEFILNSARFTLSFHTYPFTSHFNNTFFLPLSYQWFHFTIQFFLYIVYTILSLNLL